MTVSVNQSINQPFNTEVTNFFNCAITIRDDVTWLPDHTAMAALLNSPAFHRFNQTHLSGGWLM